MRYVLGFLCVCALGTVALVGCGETAGDGGSGGSAGDGGGSGAGGCNDGFDCCQAPLSDYCEGSECQTWDEAVAWAEKWGRSQDCLEFEVYSGPCGDLRYITSGTRFAAGFWQGVVYFDDAGALVAVERVEDVFIFCDDTSFNIWYGPIPDCERDDSNIWQNFCKGWGFEYCASVAECGAVSENECLARYNDRDCDLRWDRYVGCFRVGGTCESCATEHLPAWEACAEGG